MRLLAGIAASTLLWPLAVSAGEGVTPDTNLLGLMKAPEDPNAKMLVEADNLVYDLDKNIVTASGKVVIYYGNYVTVADQVAVNRKTKRVTATGHVQITDPNGTVARGDTIDLTNDLREGVAEAFELVTADQIAFQARHAKRENGDVTTFEDATYLPCVDCNGVKGRKPIWQIRANRIIHKQGEKTVVMENATFEFLGVPLAWVPMMSQPDPSVTQKTGLLMPTASYKSSRGIGFKVPYYLALAPDYGLTLSPAVYTRQGLLFDAEWRQKLDNGSYKFQLSGIRQNDRGAMSYDGDRLYRGAVQTSGSFRINDRWTWGWDLAAATDSQFMKNYSVRSGASDVAVNNIYLSGVNGRNRFDINAYAFFVQEADSTEAGALVQDKDLQSKQPFVHPVIDYKYYAPDPVWGGELSLTSNITSLTRTRSDRFEYDFNDDGVADGGSRLRGAAGTFDRASIDALWRRRFVDGVGQVFTPFLYFKGDAFYSDPTDGSGLPQADNDAFVRAMPAAGLEYSYPIAVNSIIGQQIFEPVAQIIARPSEQESAYVANDDAQSLVYDAHSLFDYDKFSGYDRVEGGTRANLGLRYSGTFGYGIGVNGQFGQSFQLAGDNSFAALTAYNPANYSGLEKDRSDYVAALNLTTDMGLQFGSNLRIDPDSYEANRVEAQVVGMSGPLTSALTYAFIRSQPEYGITSDRSEVQTAASLRLSENWRLFGSVRYDLINNDFVRDAVGLAYDAEEFSISFSYSNDMTTTPSDQTFYVSAGFRTLGKLSGSASANN
jgi:LPS-assembly protein